MDFSVRVCAHFSRRGAKLACVCVLAVFLVRTLSQTQQTISWNPVKLQRQPLEQKNLTTALGNRTQTPNPWAVVGSNMAITGADPFAEIIVNRTLVKENRAGRAARFVGFRRKAHKKRNFYGVEAQADTRRRLRRWR